MKAMRTALLATAMGLAVAGAGLAQPRMVHAPGSAPSTPMFISNAAATDAFERQEGRLAADRGASPQVKMFGRMMVHDHAQTTADLKAAIRRAGLPTPPPPSLDPDQTRMVGELQGLRGAAFDKAYVDQQVRVHEKALDLMRSYARAGDNPTLRAAAAQTVSVVARHLRVARNLQSHL